MGSCGTSTACSSAARSSSACRRRDWGGGGVQKRRWSNGACTRHVSRHPQSAGGNERKTTDHQPARGREATEGKASQQCQTPHGVSVAHPRPATPRICSMGDRRRPLGRHPAPTASAAPRSPHATLLAAPPHRHPPQWPPETQATVKKTYACLQRLVLCRWPLLHTHPVTRRAHSQGSAPTNGNGESWADPTHAQRQHTQRANATTQAGRQRRGRQRRRSFPWAAPTAVVTPLASPRHPSPGRGGPRRALPSPPHRSGRPEAAARQPLPRATRAASTITRRQIEK